MQDVSHKGGGSAGAMQDENDLHEEGGGASAQTQAQDDKLLRASILSRFRIPGSFRWVWASTQIAHVAARSAPKFLIAHRHAGALGAREDLDLPGSLAKRRYC